MLLILLLSSSGFEFSIFSSTRELFIYIILIIVYHFVSCFYHLISFYKLFPMLLNFLGDSNGNVSFHYIDFLIDAFVFYFSAFCYLSHDTSAVQPFYCSFFSSSIFSAKQLLLPPLLGNLLTRGCGILASPSVELQVQHTPRA